MEYDLFVWVAVGVGSVIALSRFVILPFVKEAGKQNKKAQVIKEEVNEELNVKNLTGLAGGAAANYVDSMIKNLEQGYQQAKDIYEKQMQECAKQNLPPDQTEKIMAPLRGKMKQAEWLLQNRGALEEANKVLTAPVIGRLAKKILSGLM